MLRLRSSKKLSSSSILFAGLLLSVFSFIFSACNKTDDTDYAELERLALESYLKQLGEDTVAIKKYLTDNNITNAKSTKSGLFYIPIQAGQGVQGKQGNRVSTHYELRNLAGTLLQNSRASGKTLDFNIGARQVIPGYEMGVLMMKVGEKARIILPSGLAYGPDGNVNIDPNTILMFDIELMAVQ